MCWKVEVIVDDSGEWEGDPLRFETEQEALAYARNLEFRWSAVREKRIVKSQDTANDGLPARPQPGRNDQSSAAGSRDGETVLLEQNQAN
jgi:hypothetical protein